MDKVVHFELPVDDLTRAKKFYKDTFGWELQDVTDMDYTIVKTVETDDNMMPIELGAINGGMLKRGDIVTVPSFSVDVEDIDKTINAIQKAGGTIIKRKTTIGEMGFIAYFKDTEGNILSLWQNA